MQNKYIKTKSNLEKLFNPKLKPEISKLKANSGFTLIETLVAITVLLLSITGPLQIASKSLFSAFYARDQITAYYLAQEGIEYVKNVRDTQFLHDVFDESSNNDYWLTGLEDCVNEDNDPDFNGCFFSATNTFAPSEANPIEACAGECPVMSFSNPEELVNGTGLWTQTAESPNPTKFIRKIQIIPQGNTSPISSGGVEEAIIKVTVEWPTASLFGGTKTFELVGAMMNWERK